MRSGELESIIVVLQVQKAADSKASCAEFGRAELTVNGDGQAICGHG